ncbi:MAG TPA: insulinase family protein, partial [Pyrinomonadaceae bacterium]
MKRITLGLLTLLLCAATAAAQKVPVQEVTLENGMRVLMVPRKGDPNIAAGWIARVGSVNERPGITGLSHLFEHMMFKGTHVVGTRDFAANQKLLDEMDAVRADLRAEEKALIRRATLGEIADAKDPK